MLTNPPPPRCRLEICEPNNQSPLPPPSHVPPPFVCILYAHVYYRGLLCAFLLFSCVYITAGRAVRRRGRTRGGSWRSCTRRGRPELSGFLTFQKACSGSCWSLRPLCPPRYRIGWTPSIRIRRYARCARSTVSGRTLGQDIVYSVRIPLEYFHPRFGRKLLEKCVFFAGSIGIKLSSLTLLTIPLPLPPPPPSPLPLRQTSPTWRTAPSAGSRHTGRHL